MKEITVKTQKDYDAIKNQEELTKIQIISAPEEKIIIEIIPKNCLIECGGSSQPTIKCGDSSQPTIECWDSSQPTIECWDSSQPTIKCGDSSQPTIECGDSSQPTIECGGSSQPTIEAWQQTTVVIRGEKKKATAHQKSLIRYIVAEKRRFNSVPAWLKYWELTPKNGKVTMYKAVKPNGTDFYTGKISYTVGSTVECPDWSEEYDAECGYGIHCSPHLFLTHKYSKNPHVHRALDIDVADIRLPKNAMEMPDKVRVKKVQNIRAVNEKGEIIHLMKGERKIKNE